MPARAVLSALRSQLAAQPSRTGSLIITIYGDAIAPRGGSLWLGSLIEICRALEIGDGVVRTAVSRLAAEGWLDRTRIRRNSYYRLAERGRETFAAATRRIYAGGARLWDGRFLLSVPDDGEDPAARPNGSGFGRLAPGVVVGLSPEAELPGAIRLRAEAASPEDARRLAARVWPLADLARRYAHFLDLLGGAEGSADVTLLSDLDALLLRVLLIHEYRRVILRDPLLPAELLPPDWPGAQARRRCGVLYRALIPASERWLDGHARAAGGPLPPPGPPFHARFADAA